MDLFSIIWQFICLWCAIYTIVFIIKFYSRKSVPRRKIRTTSNSDILPTHSVADEQLEENTTQNEHDDDGDNTKSDSDRPHDEWHIQLFQVRFTTQRLNSLFGRWARLCPTFWDWWFSVGVVVGGLTMIAGILVMVVAAFKILALFGHVLFSLSTSSTNTNTNNNQLQRFVKRDLESEQTDQQNEQLFLPMIPGVTLPLSHIGYYLSALLLCGVIHEAGHAIASFTERVPMQSCGIFIYYIYPGAFVNIPDQYLLLLSPFRQLKIICAGIWHNLILYGFTLLMLGGGLKSLLELGGWQSLEGNGGVSVVQVRSLSPMAPHLPVSSVIYQLDDTELEHNIADWNRFLLDPQGRENPHPGFCAIVDDNEKGDDESPLSTSTSTTLACCEIDELHPFGKALNASISCFRNFDTTSTENTPDRLSCLPTIQVLGPRHPERCDNDSECSGQGMKCVTPYTPSQSSQVVRVYARMPDWMNLSQDQDKVFVFEGELVDIWESVKVGILQPKYWFLPASLPHRSELMLRYISSFTLALALLNILPAFKLDGDFASHQFLALVFQRSLNTTRNITGIHGILVKMITYLVGFVVVASILLGTISSHI